MSAFSNSFRLIMVILFFCISSDNYYKPNKKKALIEQKFFCLLDFKFRANIMNTSIKLDLICLIKKQDIKKSYLKIF